MSKSVFEIGEFRNAHIPGSRDHADIFGLYRQLSAGHEVPEGRILDNLVRQSRDANSAFFIARKHAAKNIVGMGTVFLLPKGLSSEVRIEDVAVDDRYRGHGIGRAIVDRCIIWAEDQQADYVELTSHESRGPANALYEDMGFKLRETNVRRLGLDEA